MKNDVDTIEVLLQPSIEQLGYELYGCELKGSGNNTLLRVFIDCANGITADDCERVAKQASAILDVEDPIVGNYTLEVSSPGLDRPLFKHWHYERALGMRITLRLRQPVIERRRLEGELIAVDDKQATLAVDGQPLEVALQNISKAHVVPEF